MFAAANVFIYFISALIITYLVSRLFLFLGKKIDGGNHFVIANILSLTVAVCLSGVNLAHVAGGFIPAAFLGFIRYALPQLVWVIYDFVKAKKASQPK